MALHNDPRMFSGGYERINLAPHVALYANLKAREQARNEAFDNYMRNINMRINPAGMRHNERPVFEDKLRRWQEFGLQNRDALQNPRKDGGKASIEFQAGYQDLQNLIERSKSVEHLKKPGVELMGDPKKMDRVNKDRLMKGFQAVDQDLYVQDETGNWVDNPNWRPFSQSDIEFKNEPFDQGKFRGLFKDVKRQELPPIVSATDPKTMMRTITKRSVFDPNAKDQIAEIGVTEYMSDPSFRDVIDGLWGSNDVIKYNEVFKKEYGTDIHDKGDLAAAYALKTNQEEVVTTDVKEDAFRQGMARTKYAQDRMDARQRRAQDFSIARENYRNSKNATIVEEYVDSQYQDPDAKQGKVSYDGKQYSGKFIKAPKFLIDKYSVNRGTDKAPIWDDPQFFISEDKKYVFPVYRTGEKSKSGWDKIATDSKPINMADWKIQLSNDWIKSTRTANELSDEFDVEGDVNESGGVFKMQKTSKKTPVYGGIDAQGNVIWK